MVQKIDFKYQSILLNSANDKALANDGFVVFDFLEKDDIEQLSNYYFQFQKEVPNHFYASTYSPNFDFRKKTSDFIKNVISKHLSKQFKDFKLLGGAFVVKPANGKGILQAHQDWNIVNEENNRSYNMWIPLVDVNTRNGAVYVLPQSHNKINTYRGPGIPSLFKNIETELWKYLNPLPMQAGQALLYDHALLHGSPVNNTSVIRLGIVVGIISNKADMQIYGFDNGRINCYDCDENYFLNAQTETDYTNLKINKSISDSLKPYNIKDFEATYFPNKKTNSDIEMKYDVKINKPTFFEIYTPSNVLAEIKYRISNIKNKDGISNNETKHPNEMKDVAKFYNEQTNNFLKVYGKVIQAFRTKNVNTLLDYQINAIGLKEGFNALDAGCGVCGPAAYFAAKTNCKIEAITISTVQVEKAKQNVLELEQEHKVNVIEGDYHRLENYYENNNFDVIYFLESFGHAHSHTKVLDSAWNVLKPGGSIYIKDLFIKKALYKGMDAGIEAEVNNINKAYHYNVPDLNTILDHVRKKGFILSSLKTIDIPLEEFENLTISNDFQELTGINKIENLRDYIFPVDFFELKLIKPNIDIKSGNSRYFLQNMYFMQIENWKEKEL